MFETSDTDSLFLYNLTCSSTNATSSDIISKFQEACYNQLGIEVEHVKTYQTAIISDKKKHYVGLTGIHSKEPDIVGIEGDKNDRPKWITTVFRQIVYDIVTNNRNTDAIVNLRKAILDQN